MELSNNNFSEFNLLKTILFTKFNSKISSINQDIICNKYGAFSFTISGHHIIHRFSKPTPKKIGQFVSIWKRNQKGETIPLELTDNFDYLAISVKYRNNYGIFLFSKSLLAKEGILTNNENKGKRGIRIYPPWDKATNFQAKRSQKWQTQYFISLA